MSRKHWFYFGGAGWFGVVTAILGYSGFQWEFYLVLLSYVFFAWELAFGRSSHVAG